MADMLGRMVLQGEGWRERWCGQASRIAVTNVIHERDPDVLFVAVLLEKFGNTCRRKFWEVADVGVMAEGDNVLWGGDDET